MTTKWTKDCPTKEGLYLHWKGKDLVPGIHAESSPLPQPVLVEQDDQGLFQTVPGCYFYKVGWYGWITEGLVTELGGWWFPIEYPELPE